MAFHRPIFAEGTNLYSGVKTIAKSSKSRFLLPFVVDASGSKIQVGIPGKTSWKSLSISSEQALEGLFKTAEKTLHESNKTLLEVDAVFFCEGPGSTLGLRIAAAFVRTIAWASKASPSIFKYNALDLAAKMNESKISTIQAPFRRGFRFLRTGPEEIGKKEILPEEEALSIQEGCIHLPDFRNPNYPPPPAKIISYDLSHVQGLTDLIPLATRSENAIPYSPRPAEFTKWEAPKISP